MDGDVDSARVEKIGEVTSGRIIGRLFLLLAVSRMNPRWKYTCTVISMFLSG
jgi:hypothetical protein